MKIISFSAVEILPALLDKSKTQTIRPLWKDLKVIPDSKIKTVKQAEKIADDTLNPFKEPRFKVGEQVKGLCPKCKLPMNKDDALNALSHDGKTVICSMCGQIEGLEKIDPLHVEGLKTVQRQLQAIRYGCDKNGQPKLPKD